MPVQEECQAQSCRVEGTVSEFEAPPLDATIGQESERARELNRASPDP